MTENEADILVRSEESGVRSFRTLAQALSHANQDPTVWTIAFNMISGERVQLVFEDDKWVLRFDWAAPPIRCPKRERDGVEGHQCEKNAGHEGKCSCSQALEEYVQSRDAQTLSFWVHQWCKDQKHQEALETALRGLEALLTKEKFLAVDAFLVYLVPEHLTPSVLLAVLNETQPYSDRLANRAAFLARAERVLISQLGDERANKLLLYRR